MGVRKANRVLCQQPMQQARLPCLWAGLMDYGGQVSHPTDLDQSIVKLVSRQKISLLNAA